MLDRFPSHVPDVMLNRDLDEVVAMLADDELRIRIDIEVFNVVPE